VPSEILQPRAPWQDRHAYDRQARELARMFAENFEAYASGLPAAVRDAGPRVED
jgi:phosphoenolpyruvate carboxykinase (ATP)